jgi:translation initiation factor 4A
MESEREPETAIDTDIPVIDDPAPTLPYREATSWDDMDLQPDLLRGIYAYGFETPSDIQKKAIPAFLTKRDLIAQAQSGMGKTGTFSIGILQQINLSDTAPVGPQALVLAHTHELAKQIAHVMRSLATNLVPALRIQTLMGGTPVQDDIQALRNDPPHIVIGCTGRVYDMIRRRALDTSAIAILCMDEADEMLSGGFRDQIYQIFQTLPSRMQVALFSATLPPDVLELTKKFMRDPIHITMKTEDLALECIAQYYVAVQDDQDKYETLKNLFATVTISQCILYCNSVGRVVGLYQKLQDEGFSVGCIHSNMTKDERDAVMKEFRTGACRYLVSSNLTARGIDLQSIGLVINVDMTNCPHTYLHRIGRSGRFGRKGMAINLVTRRDVSTMRELERFYGTTIREYGTNASAAGNSL